MNKILLLVIFVIPYCGEAYSDNPPIYYTKVKIKLESGDTKIGVIMHGHEFYMDDKTRIKEYFEDSTKFMSITDLSYSTEIRLYRDGFAYPYSGAYSAGSVVLTNDEFEMVNTSHIISIELIELLEEGNGSVLISPLRKEDLAWAKKENLKHMGEIDSGDCSVYFIKHGNAQGGTKKLSRIKNLLKANGHFTGGDLGAYSSENSEYKEYRKLLEELRENHIVLDAYCGC